MFDIRKIQEQVIYSVGLSYIDSELYLQFPFCPCPMLAEVDKLDSKTWCNVQQDIAKCFSRKYFVAKSMLNF